jgi:hypothetical protein
VVNKLKAHENSWNKRAQKWRGSWNVALSVLFTVVLQDSEFWIDEMCLKWVWWALGESSLYLRRLVACCRYRNSYSREYFYFAFWISHLKSQITELPVTQMKNECADIRNNMNRMNKEEMRNGMKSSLTCARKPLKESW